MSLSASMVCKVNYAAYVKKIMPPNWGKRRSSIVCHYGINRIIATIRSLLARRLGLTIASCVIIIIFTYNLWYAPTQTDLCQISSPPPKRHLQFPGPGGSGSLFFGGGLFRCARFSSGQIRNAASGSQGRHSGQPSGFELRLLPAFLLRASG